MRTFETANKCQNPLPPRQNHVNRKTRPMQRLLIFAFSFSFFNIEFHCSSPFLQLNVSRY